MLSLYYLTLKTKYRRQDPHINNKINTLTANTKQRC